MRALTIVFAVASLACEAFGYWGLFTEGGAKHFDEMAGMVPFAAMVLGVMFALGALIAWYLNGRARRSL